MEVIVCPDTMRTAQGATRFVQTAPIDAKCLYHESLTFRTGRLSDCNRCHLPEPRICTFQLNSSSFEDCITAGKSALTKVLVAAVADQVDIIVCDANLFTNRQLKSDRHSDPDTGSVLNILDQIKVSANKLREPHHRITYNFEVSTLATEQLAALAGQDALWHVWIQYNTVLPGL